MPSWERDIYRAQRTDDAPARELDAADLCARVLTSTDGMDLLKHLYAMYVDRRCPAGASEAVLREAEAKRQLIADLERLRDHGLKRTAERSKN